MKTFLKYSAVALVAGGLLTGVLLNSADASQSPKEEATTVITHYIDALKAGNVDEIIKSVNDTRFKDQATQRMVYENLVKNDPMQDPKIVGVRVVDSTHVNVTLQGTTTQAGTQTVTLPVIKQDGQWKLQITGVKLTKNK